MALTFPYSPETFADKLRVASVAWSLSRNDEVSGLASGEVIGAELASPLWTGDFESDELANAQFRQVRALANALQGPLNPFYLYDPVGKYPANDPLGVVLAGSSPTIYSLNANNKALVLAGLPVGFVLVAGDYFHFDYGSSPVRRAFHEVAETVVVGSNGRTPEFECSTFFRTGVTTGLAVTLLKPSAKVFIMPGTLKPSTVSKMTSKLAFTVMQKL